MARGQPITREMLEYSRNAGHSPSQAARHWGRHHTSIAAACDRLGVTLPAFVPPTAKRQSKKDWVATKGSTKRKLTWSCSPAAIERALHRLGAQ